jgi:hypothetical protein
MVSLSATIKRVYPVDVALQIPASWQPHFEHASGFTLRLPQDNTATILIDKRFMKGDRASRLRFVSAEQVIGHVVLCAGPAWDVRTEPIGPATCGISVYTAAGKAIAAGTGKVLANGEATFSVATLYPNITNRIKVTYGVEGKVRLDGSPELGGSVKVEKS